MLQWEHVAGPPLEACPSGACLGCQSGFILDLHLSLLYFLQCLRSKIIHLQVHQTGWSISVGRFPLPLPLSTLIRTKGIWNQKNFLVVKVPAYVIADQATRKYSHVQFKFQYE